MNSPDQARENLKDYLTFYHELRIPQHQFFDPQSNSNAKNRFLMITSPSRMGNHLLMSLLDGHPDIPSVPGEDGFLAFSFVKANYDLHAFLSSLLSDEAVEVLTHLGSNGHYNKWQAFKECYLTDRTDLPYAELGGVDTPSILDYEGIVFDVNYDAYEMHLQRAFDDVRSAGVYNEVLQVYLEALQLLNYEKRQTRYDSLIVFSGMRVQADWICQTYAHAKVLCSLRSFESYAVSHIKTRMGNVALTPERVQEAWEHWYHKVIDMIYLKLMFPDKVGLLTYENLIQRSGMSQRAICDFLALDHHPNMDTATVFGIPVKGNSWASRMHESAGVLYEPEEMLDPSCIPEDAQVIWDSLNLLALNGE